MNEQIVFTLRDAKGKPHRYDVDLHPASEGQVIVWTLIGLAAEPFGRLAADLVTGDEILAALSEMKGGDAGGVLDDPAALAKLLERVDMARIGADVRKALTSGLNAPELTTQILRYTLRDGTPLDDPQTFSNAYRGNYGELLSALLRIVRENGFFPLSGILPSGS